MVYVSKKDKETSVALLRRFSRVVQQSGVLLEARKLNYYKKPSNTLAKKKSALRRMAKKAEREKLAKLGKLK